MTRIVWLTDIHLNFVESEITERLLDEVNAASPEAVLIGGDIGESQNVQMYLSRFAARVACPIYFVLGNHDFYHSSVPVVRQAMGTFCDRHANLCYLTLESQAIELATDVGLIGHDGWADARLGDYLGSDVFLSDYALIEELAGHYHLDRRPMLQRLGDEAAAQIGESLPHALARYRHVVLLTHVPPFREACWHEGHLSDDNWLPHFTCKAIGDVILKVMQQHPTRKLTVLCGHTHGEGEARPLDNVHVLTGRAIYGAPAITRVFESTSDF
ncbi:MAG: metallophosphoesterase [Planctomycetaceae bacterium]|nr:metallophosphoesterase [Planctomycetales bacterium]MCB9874992.1 metallophosphoesterase [Planctomycetaceae bacterium]HRX80330.1 metallophosphoesterase [Pirellulaceae bacterium]